MSALLLINIYVLLDPFIKVHTIKLSTNLYGGLWFRGFPHCFLMDTLCPHESDILIVRGGHLKGPHVFLIFDTCLPLLDMVPNVRGIHGEMNKNDYFNNLI